MLRIRETSAAESAEVERLARSRTEGARGVERAGIIRRSSRCERVPAIAGELRVSEGTARLWIERLNQSGIEGLADLPRSGKPPTYAPDRVGEVVATSLANPRGLELPFASWTLDRSTAYPNEEKGSPIKRSRVGRCPIRLRPHRLARQEIDYGRRGYGCIYGAFRPATGEVYTEGYEGSTTAGWVPEDAERVYAIGDNLAMHRTPGTRAERGWMLLFCLAHPR